MECHLPTGPPPRRSWGRPQGRLPAPVPLTSTARLHAQPWEAPRAPPASRPAPTRARPLGAAWRDPAPPPRRPPQGRPRPAEWAVQCGGGVPGASPPPGRGHAQAPHVTRVPRVARGACGGGTAEFRIPPSQTDGCVSGSSIGLGLRGGSGSPSIPTEAPGLAAAGHCWSTKGLAPQRPPFPPPWPAPALLVETSLPGTLSGFGVQRRRQRVSCHPLYPAAGAGAPAQGAEAWSVPAPPPAAWRRQAWICGGGATWRLN